LTRAIASSIRALVALLLTIRATALQLIFVVALLLRIDLANLFGWRGLVFVFFVAAEGKESDGGQAYE
jgi:hypothetical protein